MDYGADIKSCDSSGQSIFSLMMVNMPAMVRILSTINFFFKQWTSQGASLLVFFLKYCRDI